MNEIHRWFAVRVRSRCEKAAAAALEGRDIEVCAAVSLQRRMWSDRTKLLEVPLFPGYIFAFFDSLRRQTVLTSPGVISIVGFGAELCPVDDGEIAAIQAILRSNAGARSWPFLRVGDRVRVKHGVLTGAEGILIRVKAQWRLIVSVALLQRSVAVEMDEAMVEPAPQRMRGAA